MRTAPHRVADRLRQYIKTDVAERLGRREGAVLARHGVGLGVVQEHLAALELLDGDVALRGEARAGLRGVMPSRNCSTARHRRARPGRWARTATISFLATTLCVFSQSCAAVKGR